MGKTRMNEGEGEGEEEEKGGGDDVMLRELVFVRRQDHCAVVTGYHPSWNGCRLSRLGMKLGDIVYVDFLLLDAAKYVGVIEFVPTTV